MGSRLGIRSTTYVPAENHEWVGSEHGLQTMESGTLLASAFASFAGLVPSGVLLAKNTAGTRLIPYAGVSEVQTVGLGAATAGTVTLGIDGETTAPIAFNATAAQVQTALEGLSNVSPGDIVVSGAGWPGVLTFSFGTGRFAGSDVPTLTVTPTGLTGGAVAQATTVAGGSGGQGKCVGHLGTTTIVGTDDTSVPVYWHGRVIISKLPAGSGYDPSVQADLPTIRYV